MFTNGYHLDYGVTRLFVYNVTDMLSDKDKLCARITNLSSIEVKVILVTLIVCMYSIEYLAVSNYCLSHYFHLNCLLFLVFQVLCWLSYDSFTWLLVFKISLGNFLHELILCGTVCYTDSMQIQSSKFDWNFGTPFGKS